MTRTLLLFLILILGIYIPAFCQETGNAWPLPDYYHNPDKIHAEILELAAQYPELMHWEILCTTYTDHQPLYAVKISRYPHIQRNDVPAILIAGPHHSEEVLGVEYVMYEMKQILQSYGKDPFLTTVVDSTELWFIPTINPEGYRYVSYGINPFHRKNATDTNMNGYLDFTKDGVDLNKSYDINWDNDAGVDPEEFYYKGPSPASEAETQAMQNLFARERFQYAIFYHSSITGNFAERIYFPWNWFGIQSPDYQDMKEIGLRLARQLPRDYQPGNYRISAGWSSPLGFARDYIYAKFGTYAYDIESGGINKDGVSIIRPYKSMLETLKQKHFHALEELFRISLKNTFKGQIIYADGTPATNLPLQFPERTIKFKAPFRTNADGYFFRYLNNFNLDFIVNHGPQFRTDYINHFCQYRLSSYPDPQFADTDSESQGVVFSSPFSRLRSPTIVPASDSVWARIDLHAGNQWAYYAREKIGKRYWTVNQSDFTRMTQGTIEWKLMTSSRLLDEVNRKFLVLSPHLRELSWCGDISKVNGYWLQNHTILCVQYPVLGKPDTPLTIHGIHIQGTFNHQVLRIRIEDPQHVKTYFDAYLPAENDSLTVKLPPIPISGSFCITLENLSDLPCRFSVEASPESLSHCTYLFTDDWMPLDIPDPAITILLRDDTMR